MTSALHAAASLLSFAGLVLAKKPPSQSELDALLARYLTLDHASAAGHTEGEALLARLQQVPPLDAAQLAAWRTRIAKAWTKGKKLELAGDQWFWPGDAKAKTAGRGRYIVGGETKKPVGLAIAMHGGGVGSGDAGSAAGGYGGPLAQLGLVMIAPEVLEKTERGWTDSGSEEFVLALVDAALRTWKLDPDKVFFVGHSMGGYGSWVLGAHHADRVAAIAPSAGAPTPIYETKGGPVVDMQEGVFPSLRSVFVAVYQSRDDAQVPPAPNQFAVKKLAECAAKWGGFAHEYWEVDGRGHGEPPGGHGALVGKIVGHVRTPTPGRVVWQPALAWKRQFHWLYWERPAIGAVVVADADRATNTITITCDRPTDGLHVLLDERLVELGKDVTVVVNGAAVWRGRAVPSLATLWRTSVHPDGKLQFAVQVPAFAAPTTGR